MNPANIAWSTDEEKVAAAGATGGIVSLQVNGDLYPEKGRRREGASLITKKAFGPGKYEVRFKTVPRSAPLRRCGRTGTAAAARWRTTPIPK